MMAYLRIKKIEDSLIRKIGEELNRQRLDRGKEVMKDSEIMHELLLKSMKKVKIEDGELII